jgi:hypothetical protein
VVTLITDSDPGANQSLITRKWAELFTEFSGVTGVVKDIPGSSVFWLSTACSRRTPTA